MKLRSKVLSLGLGMTFLSVSLLGAGMGAVQREGYMEQVRVRARAFLSVVVAASVRDLASNRIEELDRVVASLLEKDLKDWDIRFVALVDSHRRVVAHTSQPLYGTVLDDPFTVEAAESDAPVVRDGSGDTDVLLASMPVTTAVPGQPGIRWGTVVAGFGLERVRSHLLDLLGIAAGAVALALLLTAAPLVLLLHRQLVRPVQVLTGAVRAFAAGDLARRTRLKCRDELAELSHGFNDMAERIEGQTRDLERQVAERTHELAEANRALTEANTRLQGLATTDGLTGLHNYRHFASALSDEVQRSRRSRLPVSLLMIDVDRFKAFNDSQGHPAGDQVLRDLARHVRSRLRRTDHACRYGGEEFSVILVETPGEDARRVAEDLRSLVARERFCDAGGNRVVPVTISVGVASFPADAETAEDLVKAADAACYLAKQGGRNRVEAARKPPMSLEG